MDNILSRVLRETIERRKLSVRQAAKEMGIAHTTLNRVLATGECEYATVLKIAKWTGVPTSTLINAPVAKDEEELTYQLNEVLSHEPRLKAVFAEAVRRLNNGEMSEEALRELVAYMAYRINFIAGSEGNDGGDGSGRPAERGK